jgi:hypothetical protein
LPKVVCHQQIIQKAYTKTNMVEGFGMLKYPIKPAVIIKEAISELMKPPPF